MKKFINGWSIFAHLNLCTMNEFWETRYSNPTYAYGTKPNVFFKECIDKLPAGRLLLPAEGEGRNAVYAALRGWTVDAFDFSEAAKAKALALAGGACTTIQYDIATLQNFDGQPNIYDMIGLIYVHQPPALRQQFHKRLVSWLKPSGYLVLEAFHKEQLGNSSGGPQQADMLFNRTELLDDFKELDILQIDERYTDLNEGPFHSGSACVIRLIARKNV